MIPKGNYRHFKGKYYQVIDNAKHSETLEDMVVYRSLYGEGGLWVRPASMWSGQVTSPETGLSCLRFQPVEDSIDNIVLNPVISNAVAANFNGNFKSNAENENKFSEAVAKDIQERKEIVFDNEAMTVERIYSYGAKSEKNFWYESAYAEWVQVTSGEAILRFEKEDKKLTTGESLFIPSFCRHRVEFTSDDCQWLCVYLKKSSKTQNKMF